MDSLYHRLMKQIVVAMDKNRAIGLDGDLPWGRGLKDDLAHFRRLTLNTSVIMGRKTFESIGKRPLEQRENIVVTSRATGVDGVLSVGSLQSAYSLARYPISIIGGGQIYAQAIDDADVIFASLVDAEFAAASVFFPIIDPSIWQEVNRIHHEADERNSLAFDLVEYRRR